MIYVMLFISIICPIYTYILYPVILIILPKKKRLFVEKNQFNVHVFILNKEKNFEKCRENILASGYPAENLEIKQCLNEITDQITENCKNEIVIFTDGTAIYEEGAIEKLIRPFSDPSIGCVVGMQKKVSEHKGGQQEGVFWKYENFVRKMESEVGMVSGANNTIFAIRSELIPSNILKFQNVGFFLSTWTVLNGWDVYYESEAVAYEIADEKVNKQFTKHVKDAMTYWQAFVFFWKMLLPRKGSFIYISHRVIKWFVPFNMLFLFGISIILGWKSLLFSFFALLQIIIYAIAAIWIKANIKNDNLIAKILNIAAYFISLNVAMLLGLFELIRKGTNA